MSFDTDMDRGEMADEALDLTWPEPLDPDVFIRVANLTEREQRERAVMLMHGYIALHREHVEFGLYTDQVESMAVVALHLHRLGIFDWTEVVAYAEVAAVLLAKDQEEDEMERERPDPIFPPRCRWCGGGAVAVHSIGLLQCSTCNRAGRPLRIGEHPADDAGCKA